MLVLELIMDVSVIPTEEFHTIVDELCVRFNAHYAYSLCLDNEYSCNESKIKRGIFGTSWESPKGIGIWYPLRKKVKEGYMRRVYPINYLNHAHLELPEMKQLLTKGIGQLSTINNKLHRWQLSDEEIPFARNILHPTGYVAMDEKGEPLIG